MTPCSRDDPVKSERHLEVGMTSRSRDDPQKFYVYTSTLPEHSASKTSLSLCHLLAVSSIAHRNLPYLLASFSIFINQSINQMKQKQIKSNQIQTKKVEYKKSDVILSKIFKKRTIKFFLYTNAIR